VKGRGDALQTLEARQTVDSGMPLRNTKHSNSARVNS
jgi:hypothetical protein